jgi:hypothetical protein
MALKLDRRTVLKGIGGGVALPVLECMLDANGEAYAQGMQLPKRYALLFAGQAIGGDDWAEDQQRVAGRTYTETGHHITPSSTGPGYTLTTPLEPLADLRNDFSIVSGMRIPFNASGPNDPVPAGGAYRDFHGGGCSPLLSGTRSTEAAFTCNGPTSDQVIATLNNGLTTVPSLVYRAQPVFYLTGYDFSGRQYISYRGAGQRVAAQDSPQVAFRNLFAGFQPADPGDLARHEFTLASRRSVLDVVLQKRDRLLGRVGRADHVRLERHFDEIRDLETRIAAIPPVASGECRIPADPGADPAVGGDNAGSGSGGTTPIQTNTGYSDEDLRARVFADLIHMAFVCDLTRAATLQITTFQCHMNCYQLSSSWGTPFRADLHELGHNGDEQNRGQLPISIMLGWHIGIYAYLMQKLKDSPEGTGNVLDNCSLVFTPEAGHGLQLNDGSSPNATHSVDRMIMLVGGHAGGLVQGRHIAANGRHPASCLLSAMRAAGHTGTSFGDVNGHITELFA